MNDLWLKSCHGGSVNNIIASLGWICGKTQHSLKRALSFNRRGEITDRTSENQHLRMMHLNLLTAIIIYWNTKHLGHIVSDMQKRGNYIPPERLSHLSPLGWEHIILTGHYKWEADIRNERKNLKP